MKLTKWFPANINPAYPGVYEVKYDLARGWYRRWDGKNWFCGYFTPEHAALSDFPLLSNDNSWRGLAEPPKGWKK